MRTLPGFLPHNNYHCRLVRHCLLSLQQSTPPTAKVSLQHRDTRHATEITISTPFSKHLQVKDQQQQFLLPIALGIHHHPPHTKRQLGISPMGMPTLHTPLRCLSRQRRNTDQTRFKKKHDFVMQGVQKALAALESIIATSDLIT